MKTMLILLLGIVLGVLGYGLLRDDGHEATHGPDPAAVPADTAVVPQADRISAPEPASAAAPPPAPGMVPAAAAADAGTAGNAGLMVPVQGIAPDQLQDTFTDARSEGRVHDAIDIMAPTGTPVVAVADGTVEKLFTSERGGLTVYQFEPGGRFAYYYAHLERYADGLAEKQPLRRGQVLGYVGSTGNADPAAPHLHFAIFRLGPEKHWWEGEALNPYPLLRGAPLP